MKPTKQKSLFKFFHFFTSLLILLMLGCESQPCHDHRGDTVMEEGGLLRSSGCDYTFFSDRVFLEFEAYYNYRHNGPPTFEDIPEDIVIIPKVFDGSNDITSSTNISYSFDSSIAPDVTVVQKSVSSSSGCLGGTGLHIRNDNLKDTGEDYPQDYSFETRFTIKITVKNLSHTIHNLQVKFIFPNGGLHPTACGGPWCQEKVVNVKVCPIGVNDVISLQDVNSILIDGEGDPTDPTSIDWPRFELIKKEDQIILIPYSKDDFGQ